MTETTSRLKIMLVEDDAGLAELETKRLQRSGYEVSVAYSATEAFKLLQTTKFDLILLDYRLPDCSDGLEFYSKMRTHGFDLPVILVTGFSNEAAAIRALRSGVRDYICKSTDFLEYLPESVHRVLSQVEMERRVVTNEQQFRSAFENTNVAMAMTSIDNRIERVNKAFASLLGYSVEEMLQLTMRDLTHPEDVAESYERRADLLAGKQEYFQIEKRYLHKDGHVVWGLTNVALLRDEEGQPCSYFAQIQDLTARKLAEASLNLVRTLIDKANDCIEVIDPESGRYLDVNERALIMHGFTREEYLSLTVPDVDVTLNGWAKRDWDMGDLGHQIVEGTHRRKDGSTFPVEVNVTSVHLHRDYLIAVVRDITERKSTEAALAASEAFRSAVWSSSLDAIIMMDDQGRICDLNPAAERMFCCTRQQIIGEDLAEHFIPPSRREHHRTGLARYLATGEQNILNQRREFVALRFQGLEFPAEVTIVPVHVDGTTRFIGTIRDISERKRTDTNLRESLERYEILSKATNDCVWDWDLTQNRVLWNDNVYEMFGFRPEEMGPGVESWTNRIDPADKERILASIHNALDSGLLYWKDEYRFLRSDGSYADIFDRGYVIHDETGRPIRMIGAMQDITVRKRVEQQVNQLNRTYAVLSDINKLIVREQSPEALLADACRIAVEQGAFLLAWVGEFKPSTGKVELISQYGASPDTLQVLQQIFDADQPVCVFTARAIELRQHMFCNNIALDPEAEAWRAEALKRGYRSMASFPLQLSNSGKGIFNLYAPREDFFDAKELQLLDELALDISFAISVFDAEQLRLKAAADLRESEKRFRELAETIQEVFWISTPDDARLLYVSPAYEQIWGRSCKSLYDNPKSWRESLHPDDKPRTRHGSEHFHGTAHESHDQEYRIVRPDGQIRWIRDQAFPVWSADGKLERVVGVARDITDRKAAEEQLRQSQKLDGIGQLAGGIAHDFNNLLTVIHGHASLSEMSNLPAATRESFTEILNAADRASNLTRQLLLFSRRQVMQPKDVDLNRVIDQLTKLLQRIIGEDVHLELRLHDKPLVCFADAGMIDQLLLNLAVNARDAMTKGGFLRIETTLRHVDADAAAERAIKSGDYVCLTVADTGEGIPTEILPHIFEPFFTTKAPGKGTGLGLATVFGIVKQHNGAINVESSSSGTTFTVLLPKSDQAHVIPAPIRKHSPSARGNETILVVEDEDHVRNLTRKILELNGYSVLEAPNGVEAQEVWERNKSAISLLLTDLVMPAGVSGQQLARKLQTDRPELNVIFMSGYSSDIAGKEFELRNGQNFLQKPFRPDQLLQTIRLCLDR